MSKTKHPNGIAKYHGMRGCDQPRFVFKGMNHKMHRRDGVEVTVKEQERSQSVNPHKPE